MYKHVCMMAMTVKRSVGGSRGLRGVEKGSRRRQRSVCVTWKWEEGLLGKEGDQQGGGGHREKELWGR